MKDLACKFCRLAALLLALAALTGVAVGHGDEHRVGNLEEYDADVTFTLRTAVLENGLGFVGVGGDIDGVVNPVLVVPEGAVVELVLINGDGLEHDVTVSAFNAMAEHVATRGQESSVAFRATEAGTYQYHCALVGHREAGMQGQLLVLADKTP
jgi:nitrite reductase (NO-forming)